MIRGFAAFSSARDGDLRSDASARAVFAASTGISSDWATVSQVHGGTVVEVEGPGNAGAADALFTTRRDLPVAVFTADCYSVALVSGLGAGVAHGGWRGLAAGVVRNLRETMTAVGAAPTHASIGPGIGPCCFEVGEEVRTTFGGYETLTTWGTQSVDLGRVIRDELNGLAVSEDGRCTRCEDGLFSHRGSQTTSRMAGVAWLR